MSESVVRGMRERCVCVRVCVCVYVCVTAVQRRIKQVDRFDGGLELPLFWLHGVGAAPEPAFFAQGNDDHLITTPKSRTCACGR